MPRRPRRPRRFRTYSASMRHRAALHSILWINSSMLESPGIAFTVFAFLLVLGPLVFVHEYGHYIVGRWCGVTADAFSIGFGRKRSEERRVGKGGVRTGESWWLA